MFISKDYFRLYRTIIIISSILLSLLVVVVVVIVVDFEHLCLKIKHERHRLISWEREKKRKKKIYY